MEESLLNIHPCWLYIFLTVAKYQTVRDSEREGIECLKGKSPRPIHTCTNNNYCFIKRQLVLSLGTGFCKSRELSVDFVAAVVVLSVIDDDDEDRVDKRYTRRHLSISTCQML